MVECFPEPISLDKVKFELDLCSYATITDLRNVTELDTPSFAKKVDLVSLKPDVDKIDINKQKNLSKQINQMFINN